MPIIKIPKQYLVNQDEDSIIVNVPASVLELWKSSVDRVESDQVRSKLEALKITEADITDAVNWVRQNP